MAKLQNTCNDFTLFYNTREVVPEARVRKLTKYTNTCYTCNVLIHATVRTDLHLRKTLSELKLACDIYPKIVDL